MHILYSTSVKKGLELKRVYHNFMILPQVMSIRQLRSFTSAETNLRVTEKELEKVAILDRENAQGR
jgi:hypothetical protein